MDPLGVVQKGSEFADRHVHPAESKFSQVRTVVLGEVCGPLSVRCVDGQRFQGIVDAFQRFKGIGFVAQSNRSPLK